MTWLYQGTPVNELPEETVGFVYIITNNLSGKKYIGKKLAKFAKTSYKTVKLKNGTKKKKKIRSKIDSDWLTYWSSSEDLKADVAALGEDKFSREILRYCNSKNELSYYEAKYQFEYDVLLDENKWYNGWISVKVRKFKLQ
jgi:hypothetical protein